MGKKESSSDQVRQADELAREILTLARNTLLVHMRFLDVALSRLAPASYPGTLATDGEHLFYDTYYVLESYRAERERSVRDYLHIVFHCVFHHLFTGPEIDRRRWDTACDIAVEDAITALELPGLACRRQEAQRETLRELHERVHPLTAEKLYREFADQKLTDRDLARLREPFIADDHRAWYLPLGGGQEERGRSGSGGQRGDMGRGRRNGGGEQGSRLSPADAARRGALRESWQEVSRRMQVELDTLSPQRGSGYGAIAQELRPVTKEKYDYAEFLRRYMTLGEVTHVSDEEFDYIFYTYGLRLYGNLPLVEPLEYQEVRRVRELAVAIDTSGSVSGELVQRFITKTYNILCQQENFFTKMNLHILQCDARVQEDRRITCRSEFDEYLAHMKLRGFGGTDFRPVFRYVDELVRRGEFTNLRGLIYFTDGQGVFPERPPDYDAAFVFLDDGDRPPEVPSWAIRLVLQSGEI